MNNFKINKHIDSVVIVGNVFELYADNESRTKFKDVGELITIFKNYFSTYRYGDIEIHKLVLKGNEEKGYHVSDVLLGTCSNSNYIGNAIVHCSKDYLPFVRCMLSDMGYEYTKSKGGKKRSLKK